MKKYIDKTDGSINVEDMKNKTEEFLSTGKRFCNFSEALDSLVRESQNVALKASSVPRTITEEDREKMFKAKVIVLQLFNKELSK